MDNDNSITAQTVVLGERTLHISRTEDGLLSAPGYKDAFRGEGDVDLLSYAANNLRHYYDDRFASRLGDAAVAMLNGTPLAGGRRLMVTGARLARVPGVTEEDARRDRSTYSHRLIANVSVVSGTGRHERTEMTVGSLEIGRVPAMTADGTFIVSGADKAIRILERERVNEAGVTESAYIDPGTQLMEKAREALRMMKAQLTGAEVNSPDDLTGHRAFGMLAIRESDFMKGADNVISINDMNPVAVERDKLKVHTPIRDDLSAKDAGMWLNSPDRYRMATQGFMSADDTSEGMNLRKGAGLTLLTYVGEDGRLYAPVRRTLWDNDGRVTLGPVEWRSMQEIAGGVIAMPDSFREDGTLRNPHDIGVRAGDTAFHADPSQGLKRADGTDGPVSDWVFADPGCFLAAGNVAQALGRSVNTNRKIMGANQYSQHEQIEGREAPIVTAAGIAGGYAEEGHSLRAPADGMVTGIRSEGGSTLITVTGTDGKRYQEIAEGRRRRNTRSDRELKVTVQEGDTVHRGDVIAEDGFVKDGKVAPGVNLVFAQLSVPGANDDGFVISESAAKAMATEAIHRERFTLRTDPWKNAYGPDIVEDIVEPGTRVTKGSVLVSRKSARKGARVGYDGIASGDNDGNYVQNDIILNKNIEGEVMDVTVTKNSDGNDMVTVSIAYAREMQPGDKITGLYGDKGTVSRILPDAQMPQAMAPDGSFMTVDICCDAQSGVKRGYEGVSESMILGMAGRIMGKRYVVPADAAGLREAIQEEALKAGLRTDGRMPVYQNGRRLDQDPVVGVGLFLRNHRDVDDAEKAHTAPGRDSMGAARNGNNIAESMQRVLGEYPAIQAEFTRRSDGSWTIGTEWELERASRDGAEPEGPGLVTPATALYGAAWSALGRDVKIEDGRLTVPVMDDAEIRKQSGGAVTDSAIYGPDGKLSPQGIMSETVFGTGADRRTRFGHIETGFPMPFYTEPLLASMMGVSETTVEGLVTGTLAPVIGRDGNARWSRTGSLLVRQPGEGEPRGPWVFERFLKSDPGMRPDVMAARLGASKAGLEEDIGRLRAQAAEAGTEADVSRIERRAVRAEADLRKTEETIRAVDAMKADGKDASSLLFTAIPVAPPAIRPVSDREGTTSLGELNEMYLAIIEKTNDVKLMKDIVGETGITYPDPMILDAIMMAREGVRDLEGLPDIGLSPLERDITGLITCMRDGAAPDDRLLENLVRDAWNSRYDRNDLDARKFMADSAAAFPDMKSEESILKRKGAPVMAWTHEVMERMGFNMQKNEVAVALAHVTSMIGDRKTCAAVTRTQFETEHPDSSTQLYGEAGLSLITGKRSAMRMAKSGKRTLAYSGGSVVTAYAQSGETGVFDLTTGKGVLDAVTYYGQTGGLHARLSASGMTDAEIYEETEKYAEAVAGGSEPAGISDAGDRILSALDELVGEVTRVSAKGIGIPYGMAKEWYRPQLIGAMKREWGPLFGDMVKDSGYQGDTPDREARRLMNQAIDEGHPIAKDTLRKLLEDEYVCVTRQPVLSVNSLIAGHPVLMDTESVVFHHELCEPLNADHDGDQVQVMPVFSREGKREADELMNGGMFDVSNGMPVIRPKQSAVMGLWDITRMDAAGPVTFRSDTLVEEISARMDGGTAAENGQVYGRRILKEVDAVPEGYDPVTVAKLDVSGDGRLWPGFYRQSNDGRVYFVSAELDTVPFANGDDVNVRAGDVAGPGGHDAVTRYVAEVRSAEEAIQMAFEGSLRFRTPVQIEGTDRWTTAGRLLVQSIAPDVISDGEISCPAGKTDDWSVTGSWIEKKINELTFTEGLGQGVAKDFVSELENLGCQAAGYSGHTYLNNIPSPVPEAHVFTEIPTADAVIIGNDSAAKALEETITDSMEKVTESPNRDAVESKAKGKVSNLVDDILRFRHGMDDAARAGNTELMQAECQKGSDAAEAGGLNQFNQVSAAHYRIVEGDCGTREGVSERIRDENGNLLDDAKGIMAQHIVGSYLAEDVRDPEGRTVLPEGTLINPVNAEKIFASGAREVIRRSPAKCRCADGACQHCYGADLTRMDYRNRPAEPGYPAGPTATEGFNKPTTQNGLNKNANGGKLTGSASTLEVASAFFRGRLPELREYGGEGRDPGEVARRVADTIIGFNPDDPFYIHEKHAEVMAACMTGIRLTGQENGRDRWMTLGEWNAVPEEERGKLGRWSVEVLSMNEAAAVLGRDPLARFDTGGARAISTELTMTASPGTRLEGKVPSAWKSRTEDSGGMER